MTVNVFDVSKMCHSKKLLLCLTVPGWCVAFLFGSGSDVECLSEFLKPVSMKWSREYVRLRLVGGDTMYLDGVVCCVVLNVVVAYVDVFTLFGGCLAFCN